MRIGFIGAGSVAQTISKHVLPLGHRVLLSNTMGPEFLTKLVQELGSGAEAGTPQQAAEKDIVVLAVMWPQVEAALAAVPDWKGRVLVDATNRIASMSPFSLGDISGRTSSEIIADHAPGAKIVKAFNSVPMAWISDFSAGWSARQIVDGTGNSPEPSEDICIPTRTSSRRCFRLQTTTVRARYEQ
ncbi:NADPH-dependent F420 reductase [Granulicella sp. L46]|uniref:NADPH-dependent F420 reductase n=1 Tax=Granulicella sp. L46 TaxID=1641865 RepID=UPI00131C55EC|nr:NAD(P)-binding domain-containing protein [Granulicella sp. L46]